MKGDDEALRKLVANKMLAHVRPSSIPLKQGCTLAISDGTSSKIQLNFVAEPVKDKISIQGGLSFAKASQGASGSDSIQMPFAGELIPNQRAALPPVGILEPKESLGLDAGKQHRYFLFMTVLPESPTAAIPSADALLSAVGQHDMGQIKLLLGQGADPNAKGHWGTKHDLVAAPIAWAIGDGSLAITQILLKHGARADDYMPYALNMGNSQMVKLLWNHGTKSISELSYAISQGASADALRGLLDHGSSVAPPEDKVMTPLAVAAAFGNKPVVDLLLSRGADPADCGAFAKDTWTRVDFTPASDLLSPLTVAAENGRDEIVATLLDHGVRPTPRALLEAVEQSSVLSNASHSREHFEKIVQFLINAGVLKGIAPDESGRLLYMSIYYGGGANVNTLKILLDAGLSPKLMSVDTKGVGLIDYVRGDYQQAASPAHAAYLKPFLEALEAANNG